MTPVRRKSGWRRLVSKSMRSESRASPPSAARGKTQRCTGQVPALHGARPSAARGKTQRCTGQVPALHGARPSAARGKTQRCTGQVPALHGARPSAARGKSQRCTGQDPALHGARRVYTSPPGDSYLITNMQSFDALNLLYKYCDSSVLSIFSSVDNSSCFP